MTGKTHGAGEDSICSAENLRLGYGARVVLDAVNLRIGAGDYWFLVGPNGHGKTTLLSGLMGRLRPLAGTLTRRGAFARPECIGFVPQQCGANPTLPTTIREFVGLGLVGLNAPAAQRRQRLAWALEAVGLAGKERHDLWSLSGGQRQRALVARALIRRPSVLVADEPTAGLDLSVETALYESLADLNRREGLTVLLVSHDLTVAARYASHVALVHHQLVEAGRADAMLNAERLTAAFGVPMAIHTDSAGEVSLHLPSQNRLQRTM